MACGRGTMKPSWQPPAIRRAEISNYDIVRHWFHAAADRLGLDDNMCAVMLSAYPEVQVQIRCAGLTGGSTSTPATASSTTAPAVHTRAASATTPTSISTRSAP